MKKSISKNTFRWHRLICATLLITFVTIGNIPAVCQDNSILGAPEKVMPSEKGYAPVNGLKMYYEIYGKGRPLILLHGAYCSISNFTKLIPTLAKSRKVIAVDLQGHGRTADIDRPITYEHMAEDVAALIKHLQLDKADVFGYSMGGGVALRLAMDHPQLVRKIVLAAVSYNTEGVYDELWAMIPMITPEMFAGTPFKIEYDSIAPHPENWPKLVEKLKELDQVKFNWGAENVKAIPAPALIILGDADIVKPEHAIEMFRLFRGGVIGDMTGIPDSQLAILPATTHIGVIERTDWLLSMIPPFLDAEAKKAVSNY